MMINCGLCNVKLEGVKEWNAHVKSLQHQDNLKNKSLIKTRYCQSQAPIIELLTKKTEKELEGLGSENSISKS